MPSVYAVRTAVQWPVEIKLHHYLHESFIDFTDLRPVRREAIQLRDRILSLTRERQLELARGFGRALGREWGYAPGDPAPEEGKYRCMACVKYDVTLQEITIAKSAALPECETCKGHRKTAQWHLVLKLKRRQ